MNNTTHLFDSAQIALLLTVFIGALGALTFFTAEPSIGRGQATDTFEVKQTVTGAISFATNETVVTMVGSLDGLTGGTSYGTTTARVLTNNSTGYNMVITFASTAPMIRDGGGGVITSYLYSTGTSAYPEGFTTAPSNAQFGFSVNASNTAEVSNVFKSTGGTCGSGTFTPGACWRGASTTNVAASTQLINSTSATPSGSGSTSTVQFRITIPNNPNPAVPNGTYTATATVTATANP